MLCPFAYPVACCWMLLRIVGQRLKPVTLFSQQLPTFILFRNRRGVAQQCWIGLLSSSNIVGPRTLITHYAWFTKTYGFYPSHDALQVPTLLGVVASICTPLPTRTQQLPTLLAQQCWELLRPFARSLKLHQNRQKMQKNGCNGNVNIDVHARQGGPRKELPGLKRVKLSVICSLINLKWV